MQRRSARIGASHAHPEVAAWQAVARTPGLGSPLPRLKGIGGGASSPHVPTPSALVLHAGYTVLCASPDGSIEADPAGLYDYDTRILSRFRLTVDDRPPALLSAATPEADTLVARYRVPIEGGRAQGPVLPEDALDLELERRVGAGLLDRWTITNRSAVPWSGRLRLEVDADFADVAEVGAERRQKGEVSARQGPRSLELRYEARREGRRLQRGVRVRVLPGNALDVEATDTGMDIRARLAARGAVEFRVRVSSRVNGRWRSPDLPEDDADLTMRARQRAAWRISRLHVDGADRVHVPVERALDDLFALRNQDLEADLLTNPTGTRRPGWIVNAGVPTFTGFFGRDALTAAGSRRWPGRRPFAARSRSPR